MRSVTLHAGIRRHARLVLAALLALVLTACPRPLVPPAGLPGSDGAGASQEAVLASGKVDFGARKLQATISDDIAPGATVSLIEVRTGQTLTTTYTDQDGNFILKYSNGFRPVSGALYYFEAVKGLKGSSGSPNAVGADAVRVRTIASYRSGGWVTLTSSRVTTNIQISPMTTALSVVVSLRLGSTKAIDPSTLFGAIKAGQPQGSYPDTVVVPNPTLLPLSLVQGAYDLVIDALAKERDPVRWIVLDSENPDTVRLPDIPFSIKFLDPGIQEIGKELDLVGVNFDAEKDNNKVSFRTDGGGWIPATVLSVQPDLTRLKVVVPDGAVNGPVRLQIGDKILMSDLPFQLAVVDGHSVVRSVGGVTYLFVANASLGTIVRISPNGEATPFIQGLTSPQALTFGPDGALYVACGGTKRRVVRIAFDVAFNPQPPTDYSGTIANPAGIAFDYVNSDPAAPPLYVSDRTANALYRVDWGGNPAAVQTTTTVAVTGEALNAPRGLSFGADGRLYVANSGGNNVVAVNPLTGVSDLYLSGLGMPWSVAFDSKGNFYVSSNTGNSIFRRDVATSVVSAFASVPSPGGLDADASGYIYTADNTSNQIYLVNSLGETRMLATGISSPKGIHVDADGIFVLTGGGQLLKISHGGGTLSVFADGLTEAEDLGRDSSGNFYAYQKTLGRISKISPTGIISIFLHVSNTSDMFVKGTKLYLKKTNTLTPDGGWSGMGGVEVRDVSNPGAVESLYTSFISDAIGMAFDTGTGPYRNWLYVANYDARTVVRLKPNTTSLSTHQVYPFLDRAKAPELVRPFDVWVDPDNGNVWVSDHGTSTANDGLYVYNSDGVRIQDYSGIVNRPMKFGFDGTRLFLANYGGNQVLEINRATGAASRTFAITFPRSIAFDTATNRMFVGRWNGDSNSSDRWIQVIANYPTSTAAANYYNLLAYDLVYEGGNLYVANGSSFKIAADVSTHDRFRSSRQTLYDFAKRADGQIFHITRDGRLGTWTTDWDGQISAMMEYAGGGPVAVDGNGNWIAAFMTGCSVKDVLLGKLAPATANDNFQITPHRFGTDDCWVPEANMASDGGNLVFITANPKAEMIRFNTTTYALERLGKRYDSTDRSLGVSVYNGKVYQTIMSRHQIDVYSANAAPGSAYLETLPVGLVSPEL